MTYGKNAKIGNITVFSREGAINAFKLISEICLSNLTMESSVVHSNAMLDMFALGFTPSECEAIETAVLKSL